MGFRVVYFRVFREEGLELGDGLKPTSGSTISILGYSAKQAALLLCSVGKPKKGTKTPRQQLVALHLRQVGAVKV